MEFAETKELITSFFRKYRWAAVAAAAGILLMLLPQNDPETSSVRAEEPAAVSLEQELESILSGVDGAGVVRVLLTESAGEERHYQTDQQEYRGADTREQQQDTVIVTGEDRSEQGLIRRTDPPVYRGAIVLCQGADSARIRLAMVDAIGTATGLTSDKISVLKMK